MTTKPEYLKVPLELEVNKIVSVSTAHITPKDNELLKAGVDAGPREHPQVIMEYEHGFVISAWHDFKDNPEDMEERLIAVGHSEAYIALCRMANATGAKWLNLDCDADIYDLLPQFDWDGAKP